MIGSRANLAAAALSRAIAAAGCSLSVNTLGGREKCWPESPPRAASLWRGILRIDANGGRLETPEAEVIPLLPGTLATRMGVPAVSSSETPRSWPGPATT